jgi:hypothetical protein
LGQPPPEAQGDEPHCGPVWQPRDWQALLAAVVWTLGADSIFSRPVLPQEVQARPVALLPYTRNSLTALHFLQRYS